MKKLLATMFAAAVLFTVSASAQPPGGGGPGGGRMNEKVKQYLTDSLGVSAANTDSVLAISQRSMQQTRSIMQDESLSQDEKREKAKPIRDAAKEEMKKYLTAEQIEKLEQKQMEWRPKRGGGPGGNQQ
ncbi:hypothetical protein [Parafilimonas sp.]|uniref:hypothetical protein n=1 Tax=Parafilimonas sp. TaxID=1969739 RepID=UPI0039E2D2BD